MLVVDAALVKERNTNVLGASPVSNDVAAKREDFPRDIEMRRVSLSLL